MDAPAPRPVERTDFLRILNVLEALHQVAAGEFDGEPVWRAMEDVARERGYRVEYPVNPATGESRLGEDLLAHELWWAQTVLETLASGQHEVVEWPTRPSAVCAEPDCPNLAVINRCWQHQIGLDP